MKHKPPLIIAPITFLKNRWLTHSFFWLVVTMVLFSSVLGLPEKDLNIIISLQEILLYCVFSYINLLLLIPYLLYKSRFVLFVLAASILIFIFSYIEYHILIYMFRDIPNIDALSMLNAFPIYVLFFFMVTAIKLGKDLMLLHYENELAQKQQLQQELNFLKAQLSPHFLLNTMNNLYGLSVIKSNDLPPLMLRLSDLLRYTLYDTKGDTVALKDEVQYLMDYIELQKIRLSPKVQLTLNFPAQIAENYLIVPLLLVVFVENAFKYCQNSLTGKPPFIHLDMSIQNGELHFLIENSFEKQTQNSDNFGQYTEGGIGLNTTLRRIELLYGKAYLPTITTDNDTYKVVLNLKLTDGKN